jgi:hypothetical protein
MISLAAGTQLSDDCGLQRTACPGLQFAFRQFRKHRLRLHDGADSEDPHHGRDHNLVRQRSDRRARDHRPRPGCSRRPSVSWANNIYGVDSNSDGQQPNSSSVIQFGYDGTNYLLVGAPIVNQ